MSKKESKTALVVPSVRTDGRRLEYIERQVANWPDWKKSYSSPESVRYDSTKTVVKA